MAGEEKVITVNLRKHFKKKARWKRSKASVKFLREVLERHAKGRVKVSEELNRKIWSGGGKKPPAKVRVLLTKVKEGEFVAKLFEE